MSTKIIINGREYDSVEAMPPDARRLYEETVRGLTPMLPDADGNGVPDLLEGKGPALQGTIVQNRVIVNGREYASPEQMPPDMRQIYETAMSQMGSGATRPKSSFQVSFNLGQSSPGDPSSLPSMPPPIEAVANEARIGMLWVLLGLIVGAVVYWLLTQR